MRIEFATGEAPSYPLQFSSPRPVAITGCPLPQEAILEEEGSYLRVTTGQLRTIKFDVRFRPQTRPVVLSSIRQAIKSIIEHCSAPCCVTLRHCVTAGP